MRLDHGLSSWNWPKFIGIRIDNIRCTMYFPFDETMEVLALCNYIVYPGASSIPK